MNKYDEIKNLWAQADSMMIGHFDTMLRTFYCGSSSYNYPSPFDPDPDYNPDNDFLYDTEDGDIDDTEEAE